MLDIIAQKGSHHGTGSIADDGFTPYELVDGDPRQGLILICDHASARLPEQYGTLGLPASELERHIAFDIGVEAVTRGLAARLNVPAVLSRFSRLLIDPNRGHDDPTLIMRLSDGAVVPGNADVDDDERQHRISQYHAPYHAAIADTIDRVQAAGVVPTLLSIHSFTPTWKGIPRPWHAGLLWDEKDRQFCDAFIHALRNIPGLVVGDNEPYRGGLHDDTIDVHGTRREIASALLEIRQDLISDKAGIAQWTDRLAQLVPGMTAMPQLRTSL